MMMAVAAYYIINPAQAARRKGPLEWRPASMEEMVRRPGYIRFTRIVGVVLFVVGAVLLIVRLSS